MTPQKGMKVKAGIGWLDAGRWLLDSGTRWKIRLDDGYKS
jgi:hypothetical protein